MGVSSRPAGGSKKKKNKLYTVDPFKEATVDTEVELRRLEDREKQLEDRENELKNTGANLDKREKQLQEQVKLHSEREKQLEDRENELKNTGANLDKREEELKQRADVLNKRDAELKQRESAFKEESTEKSDKTSSKGKRVDDDAKLAALVAELKRQKKLTAYYMDLASKVDIDKEKAERLTGKRIKEIVDLGSPKLAYRVTELERENSELEKELNRLKEESKSSNIDNTKLLELQRENSELEKELNRLKEESKSSNIDNTKLLELQRENDNLRSELDSITGERDEAKDIVYRQLNEKRKLEDEITELKEENRQLTDRSESIVKKNSELRDKLDTYKIKANEVEELKEEIQILRDMDGKHKAKLEALKKNLDASNNREQQMVSEIQDLRDKVMHYESLEEFGAIQSETENEVTDTKVLKLNYEYVYNAHSDGGWLGRRPNYVTVLGEKMSVRYMYDILIKVVEKLAKEGYINKDFVLTCGLFASSKCRVHLKSGECKKAIYIPALDLYFEVNLSTDDIVDYIGILLQFCDLPDETVKISFRA